MSPRDRAIAWLHATHAAVCDRFVAWEHGTAVFAGDVPTFWAYNSVRVEGPDTGLDAGDVAAAADRLQAELAHRHVEVEDEAAGTRVRRGLEALGWSTERLVWMELAGPAHGGEPAAGAEIAEVPFPSTRPLREAWATDWWGDHDAMRRFMGFEERVAERRGTRALAAFGPGGAMVGYVAFLAAGGTAEVDQVYVTPGSRGSGTGGALVAAAVGAAGAERTFIVADDEGAPKRLYRRLGFEPVWIQHQFSLRKPKD